MPITRPLGPFREHSGYNAYLLGAVEDILRNPLARDRWIIEQLSVAEMVMGGDPMTSGYYLAGRRGHSGAAMAVAVAFEEQEKRRKEDAETQFRRMIGAIDARIDELNAEIARLRAIERAAQERMDQIDGQLRDIRARIGAIDELISDVDSDGIVRIRDKRDRDLLDTIYGPNGYEVGNDGVVHVQGQFLDVEDLEREKDKLEGEREGLEGDRSEAEQERDDAKTRREAEEQKRDALIADRDRHIDYYRQQVDELGRDPDTVLGEILDSGGPAADMAVDKILEAEESAVPAPMPTND